MDRSTAKGFASLKAEDPDKTRFTDPQYNSALDLAQGQFAIDAKAIMKQYTYGPIVGQIYLQVPTDFLMCVMVRHNGLKLKPITLYELSFQAGEDWTTLTGVPTAYYIDEENARVYMIPRPDTENAAKVAILDYIAVPAAMTTDGDILMASKQMLQYYAPAVVAWAARELLSYLPITPAIQAKRDDLLKEYQRYVNQAITTYNNMADEPLRMSGGRYWQDISGGGSSNAFSS